MKEELHGLQSLTDYCVTMYAETHETDYLKLANQLVGAIATLKTIVDSEAQLSLFNENPLMQHG